MKFGNSFVISICQDISCCNSKLVYFQRAIARVPTIDLLFLSIGLVFTPPVAIVFDRELLKIYLEKLPFQTDSFAELYRKFTGIYNQTSVIDSVREKFQPPLALLHELKLLSQNSYF
jgi:hypothetical protein